MKTGVFITTFNRGEMLARTLKSVVPAANEVGASVLVVNDGGDRSNCDFYAGIGDRAVYASHDPSPVALHLPKNRGLACGMNVGLAWFLADPSIEAISVFQDDTSCDPLTLKALAVVLGKYPGSLVSGHDAREHRERRDDDAGDVDGIKIRHRDSCRATMMMATAKSWESMMPIRSRGLGLPKRVGEGRGEGSGVDWFLTRQRDADEKGKRALPVIVVPGLVTTFAWEAASSTWNNRQIAGPDDEGHRRSIEAWLTSQGNVV